MRSVAFGLALGALLILGSVADQADAGSRIPGARERAPNAHVPLYAPEERSGGAKGAAATGEYYPAPCTDCAVRPLGTGDVAAHRRLRRANGINDILRRMNDFGLHR